MSAHIRSAIFRLFLLVVFVIPMVIPQKALAGQEEAVRAYYLKNMPADFGKIAKLFAIFQETGANMVIVGQASNGAPLSQKILANVVFLAHQKGLKLYVVVPTRGNSSLLASHSEWEDRRYDIRKGSIVTSRMIDLFNLGAQKAIIASVKDAVSSLADGILLGEDFLLAEGDGMGRAAMDAYKRKFNHDLNADRIFASTDNRNEEYEGFIRMKQDMLVDTAQKIIETSRETNRSVRFGMPLPFDRYADVLDRLPEYRRTVKTLQGVTADFYWINLPHHEQEGLNYRKGMEAIARTAMIVSDAAGDQRKVMIVLPLLSFSGNVLASTEVEEATDMSHKGGKTFVAYEVKGTMPLNSQLMKKLFREP